MRVDWRKVLQPNLAYTAQEVAGMLGISVITARKKLRFAARLGILECRKKGRVNLYALPAGVGETASSTQNPATAGKIEEVVS